METNKKLFLLIGIFCLILATYKYIEVSFDEPVFRIAEEFFDRKINQSRDVNSTVIGREKKKILFHILAYFQKVRGIKKTQFFQNCAVNQCELTFNASEVSSSAAVIIHWRNRNERKVVDIQRPYGQIWIMIQHEATLTYHKPATSSLKGNFNWTMTYSMKSDLYLPYGQLHRKVSENSNRRDYLAIARGKSKDAIWIVSHCHTQSKREAYVDILKRYISIDILGACGRRWDCGARHNHEKGNCFDILNKTYRYYLAFENRLCQEYISEKFFENYKYDIILVSRGGNPKERPIKTSPEAYISASDFQNAHELGKYLKSLSLNPEKYAQMLETKDSYQSIAYMELFQRSLCEVCNRLHNIEKYRYVYDDAYEWMKTEEKCFEPSDISLR